MPEFTAKTRQLCYDERRRKLANISFGGGGGWWKNKSSVRLTLKLHHRSAGAPLSLLSGRVPFSIEVRLFPSAEGGG